jgi:hypothetical protein|tara:strand:+ start:1863 stop:2453 length:591 start_codon:yes stop_codon:yes gene_type:complete
MSNIFQRLELQAFRAGITPRTKESRDWFRNKIKNLRSIKRDALMKEEPLQQTAQETIGSMYMFFYDPKHKDTLPYYDTFPLVIVVGPAEGGFYGLNLHYLPPILRAKMLDALMDITNNNKFNNSTRFKMSYELLARTSKLKYFKPCFKHYLTDHVQSKFAMVPAPEWEIATFLPTAQFKKANSKKVYSDSKKMIGG